MGAGLLDFEQGLVGEGLTEPQVQIPTNGDAGRHVFGQDAQYALNCLEMPESPDVEASGLLGGLDLDPPMGCLRQRGSRERLRPLRQGCPNRDALFPAWRYHPFVTNTDLPVDQADVIHR